MSKFTNLELVTDKGNLKVLLNGKQLKTPLRKNIVIPSEDIFKKIKKEFSKIKSEINYSDMPVFSMVLAIIDKIKPNRKNLHDELIKYSMNDLICYRVSKFENEILYNLQVKKWNKWIEWAENFFSINLLISESIMPVNQNDDTSRKVLNILNDLDSWEFGCLYQSTKLSGSFFLGFAYISKIINVKQFFSLSFLEELYQIEKWGSDFESSIRHKSILKELKEIDEFLKLL